MTRGEQGPRNEVSWVLFASSASQLLHDLEEIPPLAHASVSPFAREGS